MDEQNRRQARDCALRLLGRREHSAEELSHKLCQRGYPPAVVETVVAELARERWQSDARYAAELIHYRRRQGYGPLRIRAELRQHGVEEAFGNPQLQWDDADWAELAQRARAKRFGVCSSLSPRERERQFRFLLNRGFTREQARRVFEGRGADGCPRTVDSLTAG